MLLSHFFFFFFISLYLYIYYIYWYLLLSCRKMLNLCQSKRKMDDRNMYIFLFFHLDTQNWVERMVWNRSENLYFYMYITHKYTYILKEKNLFECVYGKRGRRVSFLAGNNDWYIYIRSIVMGIFPRRTRGNSQGSIRIRSFGFPQHLHSITVLSSF